ncbi:MAG TPA: cold shock and DUF1294 domain-containing protein [Coleofasciculaceae cyanobacterium]
MKSGLRRGQLTKWKDDRGFGFIQPADGSPEVFLHISELKDVSRRPIVGDTIYYHIAEQDGKVRASNAFILGARLKPVSQSSPSTNKGTKQAVPLYPFPVLEVVVLSFFPMIGAIHFLLKTGNPLSLILYGLMSLISFALYADDKSCAKRGAWRTPEKTLILCDLAGGWIGGFIAQRRLHHKVSKSSYQRAFWLVVAMHYVFWLWWLIASKEIVGLLD